MSNELDRFAAWDLDEEASARFEEVFELEVPVLKSVYLADLDQRAKRAASKDLPRVAPLR